MSRKEERGYIAGRARLYSRKSAVILPEERGYIPGRARLYCRKSVVIFPEERGYIAGRAQLYCQKSVGILPEERGYIFVMKIVAYLSYFAGCTHLLGPMFVGIPEGTLVRVDLYCP